MLQNEEYTDEVFLNHIHAYDCMFIDCTFKKGCTLEKCNLQKCHIDGRSIIRNSYCFRVDVTDGRFYRSTLESVHGHGQAQGCLIKTDVDLQLIECNLSQWCPQRKPKLKLPFEFDAEGMIVYKLFGKTWYAQPWVPRPGLVILEECNPNPTVECGSGINCGTLEWCQKYQQPGMTLWKCRIRNEWLPFVTVPFDSEKIRTSALEIINEVQ